MSDVSHLSFASCNVQRSAENTTLFLEQHHTADFVFVQEIYWGAIKTVASSVSADGEVYRNTVAHREFLVLGAHEQSRVAVYVHRRWQHCLPRLRDDLIRHNDVICVTLTTPTGPLTVLNVYNDAQRSALHYLQGRAELLPPLAVVAGDFNLHHRLWGGDDVRREHREESETLIDLMGDLNLALCNDPGVPTWRSNCERLQPQVLDLVWVDLDWAEDVRVEVDMESRHRGDHAVLRWTPSGKHIWI